MTDNSLADRIARMVMPPLIVMPRPPAEPKAAGAERPARERFSSDPAFDAAWKRLDERREEMNALLARMAELRARHEEELRRREAASEMTPVSRVASDPAKTPLARSNSMSDMAASASIPCLFVSSWIAASLAASLSAMVRISSVSIIAISGLRAGVPDSHQYRASGAGDNARPLVPSDSVPDASFSHDATITGEPGAEK